MLTKNPDAKQANVDKIDAPSRAKRRKYAGRRLRELQHNVASLVQELVEIDRQVEAGVLEARTAMRHALWSVESFLRTQNSSSYVLYFLGEDLHNLERGIISPALKAEQKKAGRKSDSLLVQHLKGSLAGIARLRMEAGLSRSDAAAWVARRIPDALASRLSYKGYITTRAVEEYMDLYDCGAELLKKFKQASERKKFRTIFNSRKVNDDGFMRQLRADVRRPTRQINFLKENVPERKLRTHLKREVNPLGGLFGFAREMYLAASLRAEGCEPSCDDLLKELVSITSINHSGQ